MLARGPWWLLGTVKPMRAATEAELVAALCPGVDGVVLSHRAGVTTFLPAAWRKVPDPAVFVRNMGLKAGLQPGDWPRGVRAFRYRTDDHYRGVLDV